MQNLEQILHDHCDHSHLNEMVDSLKQNRQITIKLHNKDWSVKVFNKRNCEALKLNKNIEGWGMIFSDFDQISEYYKISRAVFKNLHSQRRDDIMFWLLPSEFFKRSIKDHSISQLAVYFCHDWLFRLMNYIQSPLVFTIESNDFPTISRFKNKICDTFIDYLNEYR